MKRIFSLFIVLFCLSNVGFAAQNLPEKATSTGIITASSISDKDLKNAEKIIKKINKDVEKQIENGYGPFLAAIYDKNGKLIATMPNSVVSEKCSLNHAEMNTIRAAHKKLGTYDLAPYDLSIYINAEPCLMCTGGIMWAGIKHVYYSVPSKDVEQITGFDEGYKSEWIEQFKKRGIDVYGNIDAENGKAALQKYVKSGKEVYKPSRG